MEIKKTNLTQNLHAEFEYLKVSEESQKIIVAKGIVKKERKNIYFHFCDEKEKLHCEIILTSSEEIDFALNYNRKKIYIKGILKYSPEEDRYTIHNIEVLEHKNSIEQISNQIKHYSLLQRIDTILSLTGIDPTKLLPIEKITYFLRVVPMVEPLTLYVEIGVPSIGKTKFYKTLDQKINSTPLTRAKVIKNDNTKEDGEFLTADSIYIIDEFQNTLTKELANFYQEYFGNDMNFATFSLDDTDNRKMDTSLVLNGNLVNANTSDYNKIFSDNINIFKNTAISSTEKNGEAFMKRINLLVISNGCRSFKPSFLKNDCNLKEENLHFFKCYCQNLRKKSINMEIIFQFLKIKIDEIDARISTSITKAFEGLLKLLYPELIEDCNEEKLYKIQDELFCVFGRALERVKAARNMLNIITKDEKKEIEDKIYCNARKLLLDSEKEYYMAPHRAIYFNRKEVIKVPLDYIGIQQNKDEALLLKELRLNKDDFYFDSETGILSHEEFITFNFLEDKFKLYENKNWEKKLKFNYSTGENEEIKKEHRKIIYDFSFYNKN